MTSDPGVVIVTQSPGVIRYRSADREWTVRGFCDYRGDCMVRAVVHGHVIADVADYRVLRELLGDRLGYHLDCPVTPGFSGCCEFVFEED